MYDEFIKKVSRKEFKAKKNSYISKDYFICLYCDREYDSEERAKACIDSHDLILVPMAHDDLSRLQKFLYMKDEKLLTESLIKIISKYTRQLALRR